MTPALRMRSRTAVFVALLLAATIAIIPIVAVGQAIVRDRAIVVAPTPSTSPVPRASRLPADTPGPTTRPGPTQFTLQEFPDLGFEVASSPTLGASASWAHFGVGPNGPGYTFGMGGCADNICGLGYVAFGSGPIADGVAFAGPKDGSRLHGSTTPELAADWVSQMGPVSEQVPFSLDGADAIRLASPSGAAVVAVHGGRDFVIQVLAPIVGPVHPELLFVFTSRYRFLDEKIGRAHV